MDPRKKATQRNYSEVSNLYANDFVADYDHFDFLDQLVEELKRRKLERYDIVDLGSGPGVVIDYILQKNKLDFIAVDITPEFCKMLYRKYKRKKIKVECMDMIEYLSARKPCTIGAITANFSIIHVPDEEVDRLFSLINNSLAPRGLFFMSCFEGTFKGMMQDPYQIDKDPRMSIDQKLESYVNYFTQDELRVRLERAGLKAIRLESHKPAKLSGTFKGNRIYLLAEKPSCTDR